MRMRRLACVLIGWFVFGNVGVSHSSVLGQVAISTKEWKQDLVFLQETIHRDYPFLFKKTTADEFDAALRKLQWELPEMEEHEIVVGLARLVASFKYGHTALRFRSGHFEYHKIPWNLYRFNDGIFVEGVQQEFEALLGGKVISIEGVPVEKAVEMIRPVVPAENESFFKGYGLAYLSIPEVLHAQRVTKELKSEFAVEIEKEGKRSVHSISAVPADDFPIQYGFTQNRDGWISVRKPDSTPLYLKQLGKKYFFEYLSEQKTVYVRQSQVQDEKEEPLPKFYKRVFEFIESNDVERLVLDVRLNGGGNNFKNKPVVTGIIQSKVNQRGKFFVVIGRRTFSACQNLVNELDNYTEVIFAGEPTGENVNFYGDNRRVKLPNSQLTVYLSFAWWQDKPPWINRDATYPRIKVEMTFEQYRTNQDPVLDAVLSYPEH